MKMIDVRKMSAEELVKKEIDLREEISKLAFKHKIRPLENTSRVSMLRKDIARILTLRTQMSIS
ncbi:MAG: 50S ribosomal protein L29 [Proteobacteria bacterium]|jgi:large subunit ribosomal protein L29|nr:50S ribosomal protein L29 [Desulfocapsa sp.]MBU3943573.1 50S ribosomal protein L29 [Pseudomonadota bacterium]MCG2743461.1 50S ribosomal protein L29 [Desulfobacteraceae bacterium]MDO8947271.1 50S ribosomal protein L29 [Desulfocapsaceae bacterium]MBU4028936.1 50S ribosomal protein L29 [Pseudomonadota bacterium]